MSEKNTPVVAFVGLGSMGLGMAKNLLKHGHKVIGVDPSAAARAGRFHGHPNGHTPRPVQRRAGDSIR